jgi:hypothetical protein
MEDGWVIRQTADLEALMETGKLWIEIYHSWSPRPVFSPLKKTK